MKTIHKPSKLLLALLIPVLLLTGCTCGSGVTRNSVELNTLGQLSMSYSKFTGYREKTVTFKEEDLPLSIDIEIESEEGQLDLYIAKDNDLTQAEYEGTDIPTSSFIVKIEETGSYTIRVNADDHSGSYDICWDN